MRFRRLPEAALLPSAEFNVRHSEIIMSIYATLWSLKFPKYGDGHTGANMGQRRRQILSYASR